MQNNTVTNMVDEYLHLTYAIVYICDIILIMSKV